ncbi:MAG: hypothetical protein ACOYO1_07505 [Bacteroidales bacterium]
MKNAVLKTTILLIVVFIIVNNWIFKSYNILSWDVFGYYLYLPLKFIYHDLGLQDDTVIHTIIEKYHNTVSFYQANKLPEGNYVMRYSMGLSFFYLPFFFIAHLIAIQFNYAVDGFSLPYQYSVLIGGIIYTIIGIIVLAKVLRYFFTERITAVVLLLIVFSTNYLVQNTMYGQNAMSHNYLFTMYTLILWLTILWHKSFKTKHAVLLAIICGISILSRPSEMVCLLIPLLWGIRDKYTLIEKIKLLKKHNYQVFLFISILLIIGSLQFIYWKIQTGKFIYNSYGENSVEGFEFLHPYIYEVLFSFRKGWLIYTPLMGFSMLGLIVLYKKNPAIFYAIFIFFIINLYIVSSWSCWWYAQSFSQRSLVQIYPIMAILLGYYISWMNEQKIFLKYFGFILLLLCLLLNLFQTLQFNAGIINGDRMTRKYYFKVFGKMQKNDQDTTLLLVYRSFDGSEQFSNEKEYTSKKHFKMDFENADCPDSTYAHSGKYSFCINSFSIYSPPIEVPYCDLTKKEHAWIRASAYIYPVFESNSLSLVIHFTHNNIIYKYMKLDTEGLNLKINQWNKINFNYLTPEIIQKNDKIRIYFWLRGKNPVYIDDLQVEVFERNDVKL